jgi:hypothetical protein
MTLKNNFPVSKKKAIISFFLIEHLIPQQFWFARLNKYSQKNILKQIWQI